MRTILANSFNYGRKRKRKEVIAICFHFTANNGDSSENNAIYFKREPIGASAHIFVDQDGKVVKSVPLNRVAYSVQTPGMKLKGKWNNQNTVSVEICDFYKNKELSPECIKAIRRVIKRIRLFCPNAKEIIRHYDVCGKICPINLIDEKKWQEFKKEVLQ